MLIRVFFVLLLSSSLLFSNISTGQEIPSDETEAAAVAAREFVTYHKIKIDKEVLSYTACAGETFLIDEAGTPLASIFTIAYLMEKIDKPADRPIMFLFNGGPGSTAAWLHLGAFGPKRIDLSSDPVGCGGPPYDLVPNPHTLLRFCDLVFVDPVGTGYSRALGTKKDEDYWGVDEDASCIAHFIRAYLSKTNRWNSPKFLAGESYGAIRATLLVRDLQLEPLNSVAFNGVILISSTLDMKTLMLGKPGNEIPFITNLPVYAATAYYHNALPEKPGDFAQFLKETREFAATEYLLALFKGDALTEEQACEIAEKLHYFTGLSTEYLRRANLRISCSRFCKELLRKRGLTIAVHDARYTGGDPDDAGEFVLFDPFLSGISGPFVAVINDYFSTELRVGMGSPYVVFSMKVNEAWKRARDNNKFTDGFLNTTPYLAEATATNKDFRIFVANGYRDLTTTPFAAEYVFDHSGIDKDRITMKQYHGGHMMYLYEPSLVQLSADIGAFITGALPLEKDKK